ncbi:MAG: NAD(P)H-binding protein [Chitinophagaceae bacterium]|nr:NAD(P)H-binding protein [Chitinophagaceae bacterium]
MKYVITGSIGHISKPLAQKLIAAGHEVTIISSKDTNRTAIRELGAKEAIGSVEDVTFLKKTFAGADAVYTMVPPNFAAANWKEWIGQIGRNYAEAIKANYIKYVVNLSSVGADLPDGCGPVSGLYKVEQVLNTLSDVSIKHLRPSYFFDNLLANIGLIKGMKIMGSNFGGINYKLVLADTSDIADAAFEELSNLQFSGHSVRYIASDEKTTDVIAETIGLAIGNPTLPWVVFNDEQSKAGMLQAGLPEEVAKNYTEMGAAIQSGRMMEDYWKNRPEKLGRMKLEDFAKKFTVVYNAS